MIQRVCVTAALVAVIGASAGCSSDETTKAAPQTWVAPSMATQTETVTTTATKTTTVTKTTTPVAVPVTGRLVGIVSGADARGFLSGPARCDVGDRAVMIVRTKAVGKEGSKVVVCRSSDERYYRGARDKAGDAGVSIGGVTIDRGYYVAVNKNFHYCVDRDGLTIYENNTPIQHEAAAEAAYWEG